MDSTTHPKKTATSPSDPPSRTPRRDTPAVCPPSPPRCPCQPRGTSKATDRRQTISPDYLSPTKQMDQPSPTRLLPHVRKNRLRPPQRHLLSSNFRRGTAPPRGDKSSFKGGQPCERVQRSKAGGCQPRKAIPDAPSKPKPSSIRHSREGGRERSDRRSKSRQHNLKGYLTARESTSEWPKSDQTAVLSISLAPMCPRPDIQPAQSRGLTTTPLRPPHRSLMTRSPIPLRRTVRCLTRSSRSNLLGFRSRYICRIA